MNGCFLLFVNGLTKYRLNYMPSVLILSFFVFPLVKDGFTKLRKQSPRGVLRNFAKFTGKQLCQSLFFNKVAGRLRPTTLLKKRLWHRCFPVNFEKFLRTPFLTERCFYELENSDGHDK